MTKFSVHKTIAAILGELAGIVAVLAAVTADGEVTVEEQVSVGSAVIVAAGTVYAVWKVRNKPLETRENSTEGTV